MAFGFQGRGPGRPRSFGKRRFSKRPMSRRFGPPGAGPRRPMRRRRFNGQQAGRRFDSQRLRRREDMPLRIGHRL